VKGEERKVNSTSKCNSAIRFAPEEMVIDSAMNSINGAPAERNVPQWCVRPTIFRSAAFYKHLAPRGSEGNNLLLRFQVESAKDKRGILSYFSRFTLRFFTAVSLTG
jgi:hypothetical protein